MSTKIQGDRSVLAILNSNLVLWVLGAVFLTFLPWVVRQQVVAYERVSEKSRAIMEIHIETEHRMNFVNRPSEEFPPYHKLDLDLAFFGAEKRLMEMRNYYNFRSLVNRLASHSLLGLITEYAMLTGCDNSESYLRFRTAVVAYNDEFLSKLGSFIVNTDSGRRYVLNDEMILLSTRGREDMLSAWLELRACNVY